MLLWCTIKAYTNVPSRQRHTARVLVVSECMLLYGSNVTRSKLSRSEASGYEDRLEAGDGMLCLRKTSELEH